jgi:hypothetical protein
VNVILTHATDAEVFKAFLFRLMMVKIVACKCDALIGPRVDANAMGVNQTMFVITEGKETVHTVPRRQEQKEKAQ